MDGPDVVKMEVVAAVCRTKDELCRSQLSVKPLCGYSRSGKPEYMKDDLNSDYIKNSVIPPCKDAKDGEICY